jgi:type I restriction enzyme S subunit
LSSIDKIITKNDLENIKLSELRNLLLPKLMSGELDVSEIDL